MGQVRLRNRASNRNQARNQAIKSVVTKLIPTDWDELVWDIAESVISDTASNAIDHAIYGEDESAYTQIQNNYVYNTYVTNTQVNNPVIPQTFPPKYNYKTPPKVWRSPPQISLPDPILPTDIDNQTATTTPVGASINVGTAVQLDRYKMGKLIFHPHSTNKKGIRRKVPQNFLALEYQKAQQEAINVISKLKNGEPTPIEYSGWLVSNSNLDGLRGEGHILMGINSLSALAQTYRALSSIATIEPTNEIPVEYESLSIYDKVTPLKFSGKSETMPPANLAQQLGYEEKEFEEKTVEDVIKDYGKKQYEISSQNLLQKFQNWVQTGQAQTDINPIKDFGIENMEQLTMHIVASLYFRNGFHRLPATVPESLLLDKDTYKNPKDQPTILIDDNLEFTEYLIRNLDSIFGLFPLEFTFTDEKGGKNKIKVPNISEALIEIMGLLLGVQSNTDANIAIGMKTLVEAAKAGNASTIASDIARANAEYLGYKSKEVQKEIPYAFTPNKHTLKESLKDSKQKIISFENVDSDNLTDDIKNILIASQIIKAALVQPFNGQDGFMTGDSIRQLKKDFQDKYEEEWKNLLDYYANPNNANKPFKNAKIKDKSKPPTP